MTLIHAVLVELTISVGLILAVALLGRRVKQVNHFMGEHLYEIAAEIGYMAFWGMLFSYLFSFNGNNAHYSTISCVLFMTFFLPFLGFTWLAGWPSDRARDWSARRTAMPGLVTFGASMAVLGTATYFACLNSASSAYALNWGLGIGGGAFALVLVAALFSECL